MLVLVRVLLGRLLVLLFRVLLVRVRGLVLGRVLALELAGNKPALAVPAQG